MLNKIKNICSSKQNLFVYIVLTIVTLAVYWQMCGYDFLNNEDQNFVVHNIHVRSGITLDSLRWAFNTSYTGFWFPLTWLSLMFDYQLYGLNAGGYHLTNIILHIMSTLMLFWLFHRMTGAVWKSAFVAAFFALHPMHVESVAWIAERKDVLSAFFWMLTLCLYVYYTGKPLIKRYLLVLVCFTFALMSKAMTVTLPVVMILLDYWPLKRFEFKRDNLFLRRLKEKIPFFILSLMFSVITLYTQHKVPYKQYENYISLGYRIAAAPVAFVTYLEKTFWPDNLAILYSLPVQLLYWQIFGAIFIIAVISTAIILSMKRLPFIFTGWFWHVTTILPVMGMIPSGNFWIADHYNYLPSIGIAVGLAWGIPLLFPSKETRNKILFPAGIGVLAVLSVLTWRQCGYWKNSIIIMNHSLQVTNGDSFQHNTLALAWLEKGNVEEAIGHYTESIRIKSNYFDTVLAYGNRGIAYAALKKYEIAIEDFNEAIRLKPDYADIYNNRGNAYYALGQYERAVGDYNEVIRLRPDNPFAYKNRSNAYFSRGNNNLGCNDARKACELGNCQLLEAAKGKGLCR